jgi:hypothetical protein
MLALPGLALLRVPADLIARWAQLVRQAPATKKRAPCRRNLRRQRARRGSERPQAHPYGRALGQTQTIRHCPARTPRTRRRIGRWC